MEYIVIGFFLILLIMILNQNSRLQELNKKIFILEKRYESLYAQEHTLPTPPSTQEIIEPKPQKNPQLDDYEKLTTKITDNYENQTTKKNLDKKTYETKSFNTVVKQTQNPIIEYISKINPMVKIGGILLFIGVSFLLKFAFSNHLISIKTIISLVALLGISLVGIGLRYKEQRENFGLLLQGIGFGIFYLDIFASAKFFDINSTVFALALMVLSVAITCALALRQNSLHLLSFAIGCGFLAPILLSTGDGNHVVLFSYYAILNLAILAMAKLKSWRVLNLIGFTFTFIIGFGWGFLRYDVSLFLTTEPFIIFFFLLYILVGYLFAQKIELKAYIDSIIVFGTPLGYLIAQNYLSDFSEHFLSFACLFAGVVYLFLAYWCKEIKNKPLLFDTYALLGVIFLSIIVALEFSVEISAWVYAYEASLALWINLRQQKLTARYLALALGIYSIVSYSEFFDITTYFSAFEAQTSLLGYMILAFSFFINAYLYQLYQENISKQEKNFNYLCTYIGIGVWALGAFAHLELKEFKEHVIFLSLSILSFLIIDKKLKTLDTFLRIILGVLLFEILCYCLAYNGEQDLKLFSIYALGFGTFFGTVKYKKLSNLYMVFGFWALILVSNKEFITSIDEHLTNPNWFMATVILLPMLSLFISVKTALLDKLLEGKKHIAVNGIFIFISFWFLASFAQSAGFGFLYIPTLSPIDTLEILFIYLAYSWFKSSDDNDSLKALGVISLVLFTVFTARFVNYYLGVVYNPIDIWHNNTFQTITSIVYTLVSFSVILYAKKTKSRNIWLAGVGILAVVIAKLFLVELANSGTIERIVSFMAVGGLMLLIGFIAPIPPKQEEL